MPKVPVVKKRNHGEPPPKRERVDKDKRIKSSKSVGASLNTQKKKKRSRRSSSSSSESSVATISSSESCSSDSSRTDSSSSTSSSSSDSDSDSIKKKRRHRKHRKRKKSKSSRSRSSNKTTAVPLAVPQPVSVPVPAPVPEPVPVPPPLPAPILFSICKPATEAVVAPVPAVAPLEIWSPVPILKQSSRAPAIDTKLKEKRGKDKDMSSPQADSGTTKSKEKKKPLTYKENSPLSRKKTSPGRSTFKSKERRENIDAKTLDDRPAVAEKRPIPKQDKHFGEPKSEEQDLRTGPRSSKTLEEHLKDKTKDKTKDHNAKSASKYKEDEKKPRTMEQRKTSRFEREQSRVSPSKSRNKDKDKDKRDKHRSPPARSYDGRRNNRSMSRARSRANFKRSASQSSSKSRRWNSSDRTPSPLRLSGNRLKMVRLHIKGLTRQVTKTHIVEIFSSFGPLTNVDFPIDYFYRGGNTRAGRGFAFVEYENPRDCQCALKNMDGGKIDGQRIIVSPFEKSMLRLPMRRRYTSPIYKRYRNNWNKHWMGSKWKFDAPNLNYFPLTKTVIQVLCNLQDKNKHQTNEGEMMSKFVSISKCLQSCDIDNFDF